MNHVTAQAIVLTRTDYGEADRILTMLTPNHGKLRVLAKGVRRVKSKLAGGIELFSVSDIVFITGKNGGLGTLVSARLQQHFGNIVHQLDRTMLGYDLLKLLHKNTEDEPEAEYFALLAQAFGALDDPSIPAELIRLWFAAQLLRLAGHTPNLHTTQSGQPLSAEQTYYFDTEAMCFAPAPAASAPGRFDAAHIKFLRLVFASQPPRTLANIQQAPQLTAAWAPLVTTMLRVHLRV